MNVNERYLQPGLPEAQVDFLRGSTLTPLVVDICRHADANNELQVISALANEGITLGLKHGLPVLRVSGPDGDGDYKVTAFNVELKKRGERNSLMSKKTSYLRQHLLPKLPRLRQGAAKQLEQQLNSLLDHYQYTVRSEYRYDQSAARVDLQAFDFYRMYQAINDQKTLSALTTAEQARLAAAFQSATEKVQSQQTYINKMVEFTANDKFLAGWCPRGIYFAVVKLHLVGSYSPRVAAWVEPLQFYRTWAALQESKPELHREALTSLAFLKAHREGGIAAQSRDPEKLFPAGDFAFTALNAVSYFTSTINRRLPQWLAFDRLAG